MNDLIRSYMVFIGCCRECDRPYVVSFSDSQGSWTKTLKQVLSLGLSRVHGAAADAADEIL